MTRTRPDGVTAAGLWKERSHGYRTHREDGRISQRVHGRHGRARIAAGTDGEYTGREIEAEVTYLLDDKAYCKEGYVVMAIKTISTNLTI